MPVLQPKSQDHLSALEAKVSSLKATLSIYRQQLAEQLAASPYQSMDEVDARITELAKEIEQLQRARNTADQQAQALLRQMETA